MNTYRPGQRIALTTYSVKPRGGVVHTLELAEALQAAGIDVTVVAMGDPDIGFFRTVDVPVLIVPAPAWGDTLEERVFRWIEAMTSGLRSIKDDFDIVHSQDCISARAAARVRDEERAAGRDTFVLMRTVHHVDDFTTEALMECQRQAILEPDQIVVVSELWRKLLKADYGVDSHVVTNGVRTERFAALTTESTKAELRSRVCAGDRFLFLTVGGIEPRKGSEFLIDALAERKAKSEANGEAPPVLAVIGGHSFQDYRAYRERVLGSMEDKGLILDEDVFLLGTLDESEFAQWFHAADGFAFPSIKEGWGLVVLEAMAAGLPSVTSDIEVFHEFLVHGENAILTRAGDAPSLAAGLQLLQDDVALRERLATEGPRVAAKYSWARTARQHMHLYQMLHGV